ncbi:MAG: hypothetical protein HFJ42_08590 [Clostridia bacterium]|nr:hypothetical protein [Clostridia bacterium]
MVVVKSKTRTEQNAQVGRKTIKATKLEAQGYSLMSILHFMEMEDKGVYGSYNAEGNFEIVIN